MRDRGTGQGPGFWYWYATTTGNFLAPTNVTSYWRFAPPKAHASRPFAFALLLPPLSPAIAVSCGTPHVPPGGATAPSVDSNPLGAFSPKPEAKPAMPDDAIQPFGLIDLPNMGARVSHTRGRQAAPFVLEVVRPLQAADLENLAGFAKDNFDATPSLLKIKHSHHELARLIALGKPDQEVSLITGYAPQWISNLKRDPTFCELLKFYSANRDLKFQDTLERMRTLGLHTLDEIQERLVSDPASWTKRELMELHKLLNVDGIVPSQIASAEAKQGAAASKVTVNVSFVQSPHAAAPIAGPPEPELRDEQGYLLDLEAQEEDEGEVPLLLEEPDEQE